MEQNKNLWWWIAGGVVLVALAAYGVYEMRKPEAGVTPTSFITNFEECAKAGYPVAESYPRQCRTPDGTVYVEDAIGEEPSTATATGGCYIGGCSLEICSDEPGAVSTCEYQPENSCYKSGRCERQSNGACGWTATPALSQCLSVNSGELSK